MKFSITVVEHKAVLHLSNKEALYLSHIQEEYTKSECSLPFIHFDCICSLSFAGSIPVEIALYMWNLQLTCFPSCSEFLHGTHGLLCYYLWTESTHAYMFAETQALLRILTQLEAVADSRERTWASGNPCEFSIMHSFPYCTEMNTLKWKKEKRKRWRIT